MATENAGFAQQLFDAIKNNDISAVESLLQEHPELVNVKHQTQFGWGVSTPLLEACSGDFSQIISILIKHGADVNQSGHILKCGSLNSLGQLNVLGDGKWQGGYGCYDEIFPLFVAARRTNFAAVDELLVAGANVNQTNGIGQSALHQSALVDWKKQDSPKVMRKLLENGANVNLRDSNGKTTLHYVCPLDARNLARILIEFGADVNIQDGTGLSALEIAALGNYELMEYLISLCSDVLMGQDIIEAYEIVALLDSCPSPYLALYRATLMRLEYDIPKEILDPLACYDHTKEWETFDELEWYENDEPQLKLQSVLARERIFSQKYFDPVDQSVTKAVVGAGCYDFNELLKRQVFHIISNEDYLYFGDMFTMYNGIFHLLFNSRVPIKKNTIKTIVNVAVESCYRMQDVLSIETKPVTIQEVLGQLKQTLSVVNFLMLMLLDRSHKEFGDREDRFDHDKRLAEWIFRELRQDFPVIKSPSSGYEAPLAHVLFNKSCRLFWPSKPADHAECMLLDMFMTTGFDVDTTDSDGNTLLHVVVDCWGPVCVIEKLLKNDTHVHARNKHKQSVMDVLNHRSYSSNRNLAEVKELFAKYDMLPALKCITAKRVRDLNITCHDVPKKLEHFVNFH